MPKDNKTKRFDIGYGKPPKKHQFKKGKSGNPKGRPKGVRNFETELKEVINSQVTITRDGKKQTISVKKAAVLKLAEKSLSGNIPALRVLLDLSRTCDEKEIDNVVADLSLEDATILERYAEKIRHQAQQAQKTSSSHDGGEQ